MPFAVSDTGNLGHAAKTPLSHIAGADPEHNSRKITGDSYEKSKWPFLEATARGAMAIRMASS